MMRIAVTCSLMLLACGGSVPESGVEPQATSVEQALSSRQTITFDSYPSGAALPNGSIVDNVYSSLGVTFSSLVCGSSCVPAPAYARTGGGHTSPNGVSLFPTGGTFFNDQFGAVEATFSSPTDYIAIDAVAYPFPETLRTTALPWLDAYDSNGRLVAQAYGQPRVYGSWQRLVVSTPGIVRVRFSCQGFLPKVVANFDNLTFNRRIDFIPPVDNTL